MFRPLAAALLLSLGLAACTTIAPNTLSAVETANLRFTSLEVAVPEATRIAWSSAEDDYLRGRGLSMTDPALTKTPEARGHLRDLAASRLRAALERVTAKRQAGDRPARLVATIHNVNIPSAAQRVLIGGQPTVKADVAIYDARTNALLTTYTGAMGTKYTGEGVTGVLVDAAFVAGGADDLYDRAARDYAAGFEDWLADTRK